MIKNPISSAAWLASDMSHEFKRVPKVGVLGFIAAHEYPFIVGLLIRKSGKGRCEG